MSKKRKFPKDKNFTNGHWITLKSGKHIFIEDEGIRKRSEPKLQPKKTVKSSTVKNHIDHDLDLKEQQIRANQEYNAFRQGMYNNAPTNDNKKYNTKHEVWHEDAEGFFVGLTSAGDIVVGDGRVNEFYKDTPENRKKAVENWKANSFAKEITQKRQENAPENPKKSLDKELMKGIPKEFKPYVENIYKGKEEWDEETERYYRPLIVEWENGETSSFKSKKFASFVLKDQHSPDEFKNNEKPKKEENTLSRIKKETKERAQEKYGNQKWIERDESGEIIYKGVVKNVDTGEKKVMEFTGTSRKHALEQLKKNGYSLESQRVLPRKLYDEVIQNSNANTWDFDEASESYKKELKAEKRQKDNDIKPASDRVEINLPEENYVNKPEDMKALKHEAENIKERIEEIEKNYKADGRSDDIVDYAYEQMYLSHPGRRPDDDSYILTGNNRGVYDSDAKMYFVRHDFWADEDGNLHAKLEPGYAWMSDFSDEYLEQMGVDISDRKTKDDWEYREKQIEANRKQAEISAYQNGDFTSHFQKENEKVQNLLSKKGQGSVQMGNGQILEKYTVDDMKENWLREFKQNGFLPDDNSVAILYRDGTVKVYGGGDDLSNMSLRHVLGVIWDNESTTAVAGKGIKIVNYKELYPKDYPDEKGYEDDWRADFI